MATFASCEGTVDPMDGQKEPQVDSTLNVPEGVLRIFADKTTIAADGQEEVTFKVMFGSEDVSNAKTMQITRSFEGEAAKYMAYGVNKFSTSTAGTYVFKAEYYYAGKQYTDNEVKVTATEYFSGDTKKYARKVLGVYFTSTSCTSCPSASAGLKKLQAEHPGEISVVAFHKYMAMPDPMEIPETDEFRSILGGFTGLPRLFWNMRTGTELIGPDFSDSYAQEVGAYVTTCGVSVSTALEGPELKVDIGITSNIPAVYRYIVFLVEDGIDEYEQNGKYYVHNNVVRDVLTPASGSKLNDDLPLTVGVEAKAQVTAQLSEDWDVANMRVVVAALRSDDGGETFVVNNVNECKAGGNAQYGYDESKFDRNVFVAEFTGAWCINCPGGYQNLHLVLSQPALKDYKENIHIAAFHSDIEGEDTLAVPATQHVMQLFKGLAYPSYSTDLRDSGLLTKDDNGVATLLPSLQSSFNDHPAHCGVAVSSVLNEDGTSADVTVKVKSGKGSAYRVVVLVVQNKIKGYQKTTDYPEGDPNYIHNHVVRKVVTTYGTTFTGEKLTDDGIISAGAEAEKTWTVEVGDRWVLENTQIFALALDENGHVNNMNLCGIDGGDSGYDLKN